jgi:hypothetical protein
VENSNPESDRLPFSMNGGQAMPITTAAYQPFHTVPAGARDEVWLYWNNTDPAVDGHILIRFGSAAANDILEVAPHREIVTVLKGIPIEGPVTLEALAITEPGKLLGYVRRVIL